MYLNHSQLHFFKGIFKVGDVSPAGNTHSNQCGKYDSSELRSGVNGANVYAKSLLRDKESRTLRRRMGVYLFYY